MNIVLIISILFSISLFFLIKNFILITLLIISTLLPITYYSYFSKDNTEGPIKYSKINSILVIFLTIIYILESKVGIFLSSNMIYWLLSLAVFSVIYDLLRSKKYFRIIFNLAYWASVWMVFSTVFYVNQNLERREIALSLTALCILFVSISSTLRIIRDKNEERSEAHE
jgi:CDP-diglyceride synthetase